VNFKVESLQCRVGLNPQHLQSLHIKVSPLPDNKEQWTAEEMQVSKIEGNLFNLILLVDAFWPLLVLIEMCYMLSRPLNLS